METLKVNAVTYHCWSRFSLLSRRPGVLTKLTSGSSGPLSQIIVMYMYLYFKIAHYKIAKSCI